MEIRRPEDGADKKDDYKLVVLLANFSSRINHALFVLAEEGNVTNSEDVSRMFFPITNYFYIVWYAIIYKLNRIQ